ncbi:MAG: MepB family protein [Candidatus Rhabdochlamydia sp.]
MQVTHAYQEQESKEYGACRLKLDHREIIFRVAKTTPKKVGQIVFDRKILIEQGILGNGPHRGKGAFRVYSPWVSPDNKSALVTQAWQKRYFFLKII